MKKICKEDEVIVLIGKYRGKRGRVLKVVAQGSKVIVEGINIVKKHVKPDPRQERPGGIVEREQAMAISNVALFDPIEKKATRVGFKVRPDGQKVRYYKLSGEEVIRERGNR